MRIRYNAPVSLSFALISAAVLLADQTLDLHLRETLFSVPGKGEFVPTNPLNYLRLFSHIAGHANWQHLVSNFSFILLLGPILEEKYGSTSLLVMLLITGIITGVLNVLFISTGLLGASGIVFMMILLVSFANIDQGEIPLTFILIVILYLAREFINAFQMDYVSQIAHIVGGLTGSLFGFLQPRRSGRGPS
jgi:membrane associated rhomboid family serine protease